MNSKLLPLALLESNEEEPIDGITRFMKLVFLAQREELGEEFYGYDPGQYGPFSEELYDDLDRLVARGFVEQVSERTRTGNEKQVYKLAPKGERALEGARMEADDLSEFFDALDRIKQRYNTMGLWDLLEYVYGEYPEMAENSVLDISPGKAV